jgi:crotonobetainyl-CoA:carnitine CoA-transferase CaiB-like acyl-CoA transferase
MVQALYHRDRTGEGQKVDTSILNAALFATARCFTTPAGTRFERPTVDAELLGLSALYRLYECGEGWLCIAVLDDVHWAGLTRVFPELAGDSRFATAESRQRHDDELLSVLAARFRIDAATGWWKVLDEAGVPCEVSSIEFIEGLYDDPDLLDREFIVSRDGHPVHGRMEMFGRLVEFSDTSPPVGGPPATPGQHSREVLLESGFSAADVDRLIELGAVVAP